MIRIIDESKIPKERRYGIDDHYEDIQSDLLVESDVIEGLTPFTHNGYLYSPCSYSRQYGYAVYSKKIVEEEIDSDYTSEIVCPYCGYTQGDSWELPDNSDEEICQGCNSKFSYERNVEVTYSSTKIEKAILTEV